MGVERIVYGDDVQLARTVAGLWLDRVLEAKTRGGPHRVALAGGRITRRFLAEVALQARERGVDLSGVDFFWGDERCVPPTDPESNHRLAEEALFGPLGLGGGRIHRVLGELDSASGAALAEREMRRVTGVEGVALPVLDVVFLGMGEDGHVASLFPGAPDEVTGHGGVYVPVIGPKPPPRRVSLTYGMIAAAREVWVLACGAGKERALEESLREGGATPLARVLREREQTRIFTDIRLG